MSDEMYSVVGRPSIPPEQLLKGTLLIALYSIRSERQLCEQLDYNLMYRWFLDMNGDDAPFGHSVFSINRERMMAHDVGQRFLNAVVEQARAAGLVSAHSTRRSATGRRRVSRSSSAAWQRHSPVRVARRGRVRVAHSRAADQ